MVLTPDQIAQYECDGFLVVRDLLTVEEIEIFLAEETNEKPQVWRELGLRRYTVDPQWQYLATHPTISGIVAQLLGDRPRIVQTMFRVSCR